MKFLKLHATNINIININLALLTTFPRTLVLTKCVSTCREGKIVTYEPLTINIHAIQPLAAGDSYEYLGIDEKITHIVDH